MLQTNRKWLNDPSNSAKAWKQTRCWSRLILERDIHETTLDDEKKMYSGSDKPNYGLKIITLDNQCSKTSLRIHRKDADRSFNIERHRQMLISMLNTLNLAFNDYQQTVCYVSGTLMLFFDLKTTFEMMYILGRHPKYNMSGYWRAEAVEQCIDGWVLHELFRKLNPEKNQKLIDLFSVRNVNPQMWVPKWFGALGCQIMPPKLLIPFWTQYFKHGFRYLFKFGLALLETLYPKLIELQTTALILAMLRLDVKDEFWQTVIPGAGQLGSLREQKNAFFEKVLGDANSIGQKLDIERIDFAKEREHAFQNHMRESFMSAASGSHWQRALLEDEDDNKDCGLCTDGFAEFFCETCEVYVCEDCHEDQRGEHALNHAIQKLDLEVDSDTINID